MMSRTAPLCRDYLEYLGHLEHLTYVEGCPWRKKAIHQLY